MKNCEMGCTKYTCESTRHVKECVNYPESLSELFDKADARNKELELALEKLADLASECDSWESFPSNALDEAYSHLSHKSK